VAERAGCGANSELRGDSVAGVSDRTSSGSVSVPCAASSGCQLGLL
jgi:hypothetical protein